MNVDRPASFLSFRLLSSVIPTQFDDLDTVRAFKMCVFGAEIRAGRQVNQTQTPSLGRIRNTVSGICVSTLVPTDAYNSSLLLFLEVSPRHLIFVFVRCDT